MRKVFPFDDVTMKYVARNRQRSPNRQMPLLRTADKIHWIRCFADCLNIPVVKSVAGRIYHYWPLVSDWLFGAGWPVTFIYLFVFKFGKYYHVILQAKPGSDKGISVIWYQDTSEEAMTQCHDAQYESLYQVAFQIVIMISNILFSCLCNLFRLITEIPMGV